MSYMGKVRPTIALLTDDIADDQVTSAKIADTTIVNADVNASAAIAKTKLASLDIVNADVNSSAAIVQSKLATLAIDTAELADDAISTAKIADDAVTVAKLSDGAYLANRNFIDNGAMQVSQRATTATLAEGVYVLDRWLPYATSAGTATFTLSQSSTSPDGFANSLRVECTALDASVDAAAEIGMKYNIEAQDLQILKKGTASALDVTFSFWVRSYLTGIYILEIRDRDNNRVICKSYTVSIADTWEKKTITFAGDTTGTLDDNNGKGFEMFWWLIAGSNMTSGTLATSWESRVNANRAVGQVNFGSSTSNNFYLTGVQMEIGSVATPYESKSYGDELFACQRYYRKIGSGMTMWGRVTTGFIGGAQFGQHFRTGPSTTLSTTTPQLYLPGLGPITASSATIEDAHGGASSGWVWNFYGWTSISVGDQAGFVADYIECDAEFAA